MNKKIEDTEAGDWIYHVTQGWLKVHARRDRLINVSHVDYYSDGRLLARDVNPTIYVSNPFDQSDKPPVAFKRGEIIMAPKRNKSEWVPIIFHRTNEEGKVLTLDGTAWPYARKLTSEERGE